MGKRYGLFNSALGYASPITGALGIDPLPPDYQGMIQTSENKRRNLINTGMAQINAIYGGGSAPTYSQATKYDPTASYYRNAGLKGFKPYMENTAAMQGAIQRGQLYSKTEGTYSGFTPEFYGQRAQSYVDYAMPQLAEQANQTRADLTYNLANRGVYNSSIARRQASGFNRNLATQEQGIYDSARGQAMDLQKQVEASRQAAIQQLYTTQNPNQAAESAINSYFNLSQPSIFQPIGNAFSNILNQYYASNILDPYRSPSYSNMNQYSMSSPSSGALPSPTYGSTGGG